MILLQRLLCHSTTRQCVCIVCACGNKYTIVDNTLFTSTQLLEHLFHTAVFASMASWHWPSVLCMACTNGLMSLARPRPCHTLEDP